MQHWGANIPKDMIIAEVQMQMRWLGAEIIQVEECTR